MPVGSSCLRCSQVGVMHMHYLHNAMCEDVPSLCGRRASRLNTSNPDCIGGCTVLVSSRLFSSSPSVACERFSAASAYSGFAMPRSYSTYGCTNEERMLHQRIAPTVRPTVNHTCAVLRLQCVLSQYTYVQGFSSQGGKRHDWCSPMGAHSF
jgi:hypothetical protein